MVGGGRARGAGPGLTKPDVPGDGIVVEGGGDLVDIHVGAGVEDAALGTDVNRIVQGEVVADQDDEEDPSDEGDGDIGQAS